MITLLMLSARLALRGYEAACICAWDCDFGVAVLGESGGRIFVFELYPPPPAIPPPGWRVETADSGEWEIVYAAWPSSWLGTTRGAGGARCCRDGGMLTEEGLLLRTGVAIIPESLVLPEPLLALALIGSRERDEWSW